MSVTNSHENIGIGNKLNQIVRNSLGDILDQGRLAQLAHSSFTQTIKLIEDDENDQITLTYPVGYTPDKRTIPSSRDYTKPELRHLYDHLSHRQIPENGIYRLAMIVETMLSDVIRTIIFVFPQKLGSRRQIPVKTILEAQSLSELHLRAIDHLINDLTYKSPREFANETEKIISLNLLECPSYCKYIEMKATRDVLIHNRGIANEIYVSKSDMHVRVKVGEAVPINQPYFLECYEACLQFLEWLEIELHQNWHSSEYVERQEDKNSNSPN